MRRTRATGNARTPGSTGSKTGPVDSARSKGGAAAWLHLGNLHNSGHRLALLIPHFRRRGRDSGPSR